jgi:MFS family permease
VVDTAPLGDESAAGPASRGRPDEGAPVAGGDGEGTVARLFGSRRFFRLWLAQIASATGDWLGLLAIIALADRVSAAGSAAIALTLAARIIPGFFLATVVGVLVDRWNRKTVMVCCDIGRAAVMLTLPFVDTVFGVVVASFCMELLTLMWQPAKEATMPNIVPRERLAAANSLNVIAAYGTFPIGAGLYVLLARMSGWLGDEGVVGALRLSQDGLAFYVNALSFLVAAALVSSIAIPARSRDERQRASRSRPTLHLDRTIKELREGWEFIFINPIVRAVNVGLATGLIGGGMLIPLGKAFATDVLDADESGFGAFVFALGLGVAVGVIGVSFVQARLPKEWVFALAVVTAGITLLLATAMTSLLAAALLVSGIGICAGTVYVLGFTLLHENVEDDLRGRIFSALFTLVRLCVLIAFLVGPMMAESLDRLSEELWGGDVAVGDWAISIPGVRLTLWFAGLIIVGAGILSGMSLRAGERATRAAAEAEAAVPVAVAEEPAP